MIIALYWFSIRLHSRDFLKSFQPFLPWPLGNVALIFGEGKKIQPIQADEWRMVESDFPQSSPARNTAKMSFAIFTQNQPVVGLNHIFNPLNGKIMEGVHPRSNWGYQTFSEVKLFSFSNNHGCTNGLKSHNTASTWPSTSKIPVQLPQRCQERV